MIQFSTLTVLPGVLGEVLATDSLDVADIDTDVVVGVSATKNAANIFSILYSVPTAYKNILHYVYTRLEL